MIYFDSIIEPHADLVDWEDIQRIPIKFFSFSFIRKFHEEFNWDLISKNHEISEEFIDEFHDLLDFKKLLIHKNLTLLSIRKHVNLLNLECLIEHVRELDEDFVESIESKVIQWHLICIYQKKLSENFWRNHQEKVSWDCLSSCQRNLSEEFIREFQNKVYWKDIFKYQKLSDDFLEEFKYKFEIEWVLSDGLNLDEWKPITKKLGYDIDKILADRSKKHFKIRKEELKKRLEKWDEYNIEDSELF